MVWQSCRHHHPPDTSVPPCSGPAGVFLHTTPGSTTIRHPNRHSRSGRRPSGRRGRARGVTRPRLPDVWRDAAPVHALQRVRLPAPQRADLSHLSLVEDRGGPAGAVAGHGGRRDQHHRDHIHPWNRVQILACDLHDPIRVRVLKFGRDDRQTAAPQD